MIRLAVILRLILTGSLFACALGTALANGTHTVKSEDRHLHDNPNVMQLLRTSEHTAPSLQPVLHPGGVGGFGNFYGP